MALAVLSACGGQTDVSDTPKPPEASPNVVAVEDGPTEESPSQVGVPSDPSGIHQGDAPPVVLVWDGIGGLHQGFFSDPELVTVLGESLAPHVVPPANVYIRFDSQRHLGRVELRLLPETLHRPISANDDKVDLDALVPIMEALATYRSGVGGKFDVRVTSFHVGIEVFRGSTHCQFTAGGDPPPDGRTISPCVALNGQEVCGSAQSGGVVFEAKDLKRIARCLK